MDGAVLSGEGSVICLLLLPGEVAPGWGATPRMVVTISGEKGKGCVRGPKDRREEGCDGCWELKRRRCKGSESTQGLPQSFAAHLINSLLFASRFEDIKKRMS